MAEKCHDAAVYCARDDCLIWILIESWGGYGQSAKKRKGGVVLHLGLYHILTERMKREGAYECTETSEHVDETCNGEEDNGSNGEVVRGGGSLEDAIQHILDQEVKRKQIA
eukprot:CAMPEP_0197257002 /NCGR_PEP_ID=MMETSP1429-20130617/77353_1 /TAXON_ID=49237 /ORGANISM="Chaetoceros  sp., Strain UNC1202" /LENGTH=110 /DNA_ID=CAMNT_0042720743 /DNA_START=65 /DNA_END=393 /DNA_ORIENTATION=+